eukprot:12130-Eustigmatos_ZCMA.PRE.1
MASADVVDNVRAVARVAEELALQLARGPDAEAKYKAYVLTEQGKKRYDWEVVNQYGQLLLEAVHESALLQ